MLEINYNDPNFLYQIEECQQRRILFIQKWPYPMLTQEAWQLLKRKKLYKSEVVQVGFFLVLYSFQNFLMNIYQNYLFMENYKIKTWKKARNTDVDLTKRHYCPVLRERALKYNSTMGI